MSTDWMEVHAHGSVYMAKVFLTDEDEAYMIQKVGQKTKYLKVDQNLLKLGEMRFFEKVMESAKEIPLEDLIDLRIEF